MTKEIIVGYDGSAPSTEAVFWAADEANVRGSVLKIVSCFGAPMVSDPLSGWAPTAYASLLDANQSALAKIKEVVMTASPGVEVETEATAESASFALIDGADAEDLIVVGASGHHGAAAFWLGSTARHVVRHSPCPVVVVRGAASRGCPDRIVVGIDGSAMSNRALAWAGEEADRHHVGLLIVHAWLYPYLPVDTSSAQARDLVSVDAACVLDRAMETAREQFAAEISGQLVEGAPAISLLEVVRDGDLLVVGSRGRGGLAANLFGSTVNVVLDGCAVPVVVVRGTHDED
jgi:nucleotide-binding universal stress UspA family protein